MLAISYGAEAFLDDLSRFPSKLIVGTPLEPFQPVSTVWMLTGPHESMPVDSPEDYGENTVRAVLDFPLLRIDEFGDTADVVSVMWREQTLEEATWTRVEAGFRAALMSALVRVAGTDDVEISKPATTYR